MARPTVILIGGGSGAGKTMIAQHLARSLGQSVSAVVPIDAYYHDHPSLTHETHTAINYDSPDAVDFSLLDTHLHDLLAGRPVSSPTYDYRTHRRLNETAHMSARRYVVVEGLLALHWPALRELCDVAVFVTTTDELALARRIGRDVNDRGRTEASVRRQWEHTVRPMFLAHVEPTRRFADIIISGADAIKTSVGVLLRHIRARNIRPRSSS